MPDARADEVTYNLELEIKIVAIGDGGVGKTSMLISYSENRFPRDYVPTVFDNMSRDVTVDNAQVRLSLWDTAGQEEYDRLRPLSYKYTDIFLVCYAIDSPDSLCNVEHRWVQELRFHCPRARIILVGLKMDLRRQTSSRNKTLISTDEGRRVAKRIKAEHYIECSAKTQDGLYDVFDQAIKVMMARKKLKKKKKKRMCSVM